ncbi:MAG: peptidoglycan DD-metalloendopeptidase family protein [Clostridia bacterium]|nr:peptidoglycan DD-metalloendopeptidase family protein [Clostridia bacterium]
MKYIEFACDILNKFATFIKVFANKTALFTKYTHKFVLFPLFASAKKLSIKAPRFVATVLASFVLILTVTTTVLATDATVAYNVMLDGKKIGTVKEQTVLAEAEILAAELVDNSECNSLIEHPQLVYTIAGSKNLADANTLSSQIVDNSQKISKVSLLVVDNINLAVEENNEIINSALEEYLKNYAIKHQMESVEFSSALSVVSVYIPKEKAEQLPSVNDYISNNPDSLPVQSYTTITVTEDVPYTTKTTKTSKLLAGSTKVTKPGVLGSAEVVYKVAYQDGKEVEKTKISSKVVKEPVAQEALVGTKRVVAADKNGEASMCWPVKRVSGSYVSSYVGDGRGHKGMDIVAKGGTPIYAATSGTVVFASSDRSGYGKYIIIDHGNGIKTLYGHCSALYVKKGDIVSEGEHIAAVGTTGYSTGNHLHFEVRINDRPVDPVPYIGYN